MSQETRPIGGEPPRRDATRTATLTIAAALEPSGVPTLVRRAGLLLDHGGDIEVLNCEVGGLAADALSVDALARLALVAARRGVDMRLDGVSPELFDLIAFTGLSDVLRE